MKMIHADLAEKFAAVALKKRADDVLQRVIQWFQGLSPAQRNAIIGSLAGGAGTGAVSAATGGNVPLDLLLGLGLGAGAGYGGTRAADFIRRREPISSATMGQDWRAVQKAYPPSVSERVLKALGIGGAVSAAGYGAGHWSEDIKRKLGGMAEARSGYFKGTVEEAMAQMGHPIKGKGMPFDVYNERARRVADAIAASEVRKLADKGLRSANPYTQWKALRDIKGKRLPQAIFDRIHENLGPWAGRTVGGVPPLGDLAGVKHVLSGPSASGGGINASVEAARRWGRTAARASQKVKGPKLLSKGKFAIPGAALAAYLALR